MFGVRDFRVLRSHALGFRGVGVLSFEYCPDKAHLMRHALLASASSCGASSGLGSFAKSRHPWVLPVCHKISSYAPMKLGLH